MTIASGQPFGLSNRAFLITGGTGSFGKHLAKVLLHCYRPRRVVVYSRDELKQFDMQATEPFVSHRESMRFFIGDVRDQQRLTRAMEGVDVVIHAAALKQVPAAEYNPFEVVKTNILGAENVINAAMANGVSRVVALSTDKAAAPINLYGATKLASDKLFAAANNHQGSRDIRFSVVRYGNVMGSRGSVIPFFLGRREQGVLPITDPRMTRFNITLKEGVDLVLATLGRMWGGELVVPKIPSYRITDLAEAIAPHAELDVVGIRPGEKLHEQMITTTDSLSTIEFHDHYVILPTFPTWDVEEFRDSYNGHAGRWCDPEFSYDSGTNDWFLSVADLRDLLKREGLIKAQE